MRYSGNFRDIKILYAICREKRPKEDKLLERRHCFLFKTVIKTSFSSACSGAVSGYSLEKGTYYLYVTYKEDGEIYQSNTIPLYVK